MKESRTGLFWITSRRAGAWSFTGCWNWKTGKDLIKIEGTELPRRVEILGKLDRNITVNVVRNGVVVKKYHPVPPQKLVNVVRCKNPRCITSVESGCDQIFRLGRSGDYYCIYCGQKL